MPRYIALLRGVNVGGNNKVPMPVLKAALVQCGFARVQTYINSGNALFESDCADVRALQATCAAAISEACGFPVALALLEAHAFAQAMQNAPVWWGNEADAKHNAIFVIAPATAASVLARLGETDPAVEKQAYHGDVIFWSAPAPTFSRTKWSRVVGTALYGEVTIRNANTARRLLALSGE